VHLGMSQAYHETLLRKGLLLGIVHVLTPDHLSALSALSVGGSWRAFGLGVRWGIGHSTGLIVVTLAFICMKGQLDLRYIGRWCDAAVGAFMMVLGAVGVAATVKSARERNLKKRTEDDNLMLMTADNNGPGLPGKDFDPGDELRWCFQLDTRDPLTQKIASAAMGILHGFAGPGGVLAVLPTVEMTRWQSSCIYLGSFVVASTLSMGAFSATWGEVTRRIGARAESAEAGLRLFSSAAAVVVGAVWLSLSILGRLSDLMGH